MDSISKPVFYKVKIQHLIDNDIDVIYKEFMCMHAWMGAYVHAMFMITHAHLDEHM